MGEIKAVEWVAGRVRLLDQTRLPDEEVYLDISDYRDLASAIRELRVRGAPAIGIAAAYGMVLGAMNSTANDRETFISEMRTISRELATTRPTAVNLFWALDRMGHVLELDRKVNQIKQSLLDEAKSIDSEDEAMERKLSRKGSELIKDDFRILTHCNTGALAAGYGTALGIIRMAWEQGRKIHIYVGETRPLLQGARLTAWELKRYGIPFTLIADSMAGHFLSRGGIDCAIVGADRIVANGDVANKIGTYNIAVLSMENGVPFYVAAPTSTIDVELPSGNEIPIEARPAYEVTSIRGTAIAPSDIDVANPAFDVTPHRYISAIITERGIAREPYVESLKKLLI